MITRFLFAALFLCCSKRVSASAASCSMGTSAINLYVDENLNRVFRNETWLPELPDGTATISYGQVHQCYRFQGTIIVGGTLSMGAEDAYHGQSTQIRRAIQIFIDWLNDERGGVIVNGNRYSMHFRWVDDASSKQQVTNAMAHALRENYGGGWADFAFAGYSSGLTEFAAQQAFANGRLTLAATAASTSAFVHNDMTFGTQGSADTFLDASVQGIVAASKIIGNGFGRRLRSSDKLKAGFIQVDAVFTRSTCENLPQTAASAGMSLSSQGILPVPKSPTFSMLQGGLKILQQDGVNVLFGCTYYDAGIAIIKALERLDFAPFAVVLTATVALPGYANLIAKGWWQGEYFLGAAPWHASLPGRGSISNMTSGEFAERFRNRYKTEVAYQGASQFAAGVALVAAIEAADTLETEKVASAMRNLSIHDFFGQISFDSNGQNRGIENLVLQYAPGSNYETVVYPPHATSNAAVLQFPMPTWAKRRCRVLGPGKTWKDSEDVNSERIGVECSGHGTCNDEGSCVCTEGWLGATCSTNTEETGLPTWGTALIIVGVVLVCMSFLCCMRSYKNRHIRRQSTTIESMQQELQQLKDSVVNMRSVITDWMLAETVVGTVAEPLPPAPRQRAMWYWGEDEARMSSHNSSLTLAPNWVQYAGSVAADLEDHWQMWQRGAAEAIFATDLTDRISSTGTETKAHGTTTGCKYNINFAEMKQINATSGYKRDILRHMVDVVEERPSQISRSPSMSSKIPAEIAGEVMLVLQVGSIVQLSKQRTDGWAFGSVVFQEEGTDGMPTPFSESISFDAGWFPLECTVLPTKDALAQLAKMVGPAGADCLRPPSTWQQLTDPMVAQLFPLVDGPEKSKVVDSFMATLSTTVSVVKVERIQNLSLFQSFAVKRQTVHAREGADTTSTSDLEKVWLFHGTSVDIIPKIVQQGFNRSFCGKNAVMYGKGVYFARDASYSSSLTYSAPDSHGIQRMFLCRVVVGHYCRGVKGGLAPDVRDASQHLLYDTTVDNTRDPSIYVTYHDAQAYPEYLVHFKQ